MHAIEIVDLFAGPGGLDVAANWLGIPVIGIELDENACATRRAAGLQTIHADVTDFKPTDFPNSTVLAGGPPCQKYTVAGSGAGRRDLEEVRRITKRMAVGDDVTSDLAKLADEGLVLEPLAWALAAYNAERPYEAIVLEQVPAVLPIWAAVGEALEARGYSVKHGVLRTEQFGVPQTRRRAILIARLNGEAMLPVATHRPYRKGVPRDSGNPNLLPWVRMGDVLELPKPFEVVSNYGTGGDPKARGRRTSDQPAATVTGKVSRNRVLLPDGTVHRFSDSEAGRLQTFPADYPWSARDRAQQIGNAVPPRLAVHVLAAALGLGDEAVNKAIARADGKTPETMDGMDAVHDDPRSTIPELSSSALTVRSRLMSRATTPLA